MPADKIDSPEQLKISNIRLEQWRDVRMVIDEAFAHDPEKPCEECLEQAMLASAVERFPEGLFIATLDDGTDQIPVGIAITMRTNHAPDPTDNHRWWSFVGTYSIANHEPDGEWLYGVEMAVRPSFRRRGIGSALYEARFNLVRRLKLKGWYAEGMLMGYHKYRDQMSVREYGEKVIAGEIVDPTVTMQRNRGFELWGVNEDYIDNAACGNGAVMIVWKNPDRAAVE